MSTSMWLVWWNLALDHLATAEGARAEVVDAVTAGESQAWGEPLMREMEGSLQAVCSAAFACEALVVVWTELVVDSETRAAWYDKSRRKAIGPRRGEIFKRVHGATVGAELDTAWEPLFDLRDHVVHHLEVFTAPGEHPSGVGGVSETVRQFTVEQARAALHLLARTMTESAATNKPTIANWLADRRHVLDPLEAGHPAR